MKGREVKLLHRGLLFHCMPAFLVPAVFVTRVVILLLCSRLLLRRTLILATEFADLYADVVRAQEVMERGGVVEASTCCGSARSTLPGSRIIHRRLGGKRWFLARLERSCVIRAPLGLRWTRAIEEESLDVAGSRHLQSVSLPQYQVSALRWSQTARVSERAHTDSYA